MRMPVVAAVAATLIGLGGCAPGYEDGAVYYGAGYDSYRYPPAYRVYRDTRPRPYLAARPWPRPDYRYRGPGPAPWPHRYGDTGRGYRPGYVDRSYRPPSPAYRPPSPSFRPPAPAYRPPPPGPLGGFRPAPGAARPPPPPARMTPPPGWSPPARVSPQAQELLRRAQRGQL